MPEPVTLPIDDHSADVPSGFDALVTSDELATWLRVAPRTLRKMVATGAIGPQPIRIAKSLRWRRESIRLWLHQSELRGELIDRRTWQVMQANGELKEKRPSVVAGA